MIFHKIVSPVPWEVSVVQHFLNGYFIIASKIFFQDAETHSTCFDADTFLIFPEVFKRFFFFSFQGQPGLPFLPQTVFSLLAESGRDWGCPIMTPEVTN